MRRSLYPFALLIAVLLLNVVTFLLVSRRPEARVAIVTGFEREAAAFTGIIEDAQTEVTEIGSVTFGHIGGHEVMLMVAGPGMTNAAARTQALLDRYPVSHLIMTGTAGAVDDALRIGDVVIPATWRSHQYGRVAPDGFEPHPLMVQPFGQAEVAARDSFPVDATLSAISLGVSDIVRGGVGVSGDSFIDDSQVREDLRETFGAVIVDMETTAVAQVAFLNGVPFIAVRAVSDLAGEQSEGNTEAAYARPAAVVAEMIEQME